jgi:hypothetical protein
MPGIQWLPLLAIADTFTGSLARLTAEEQKQVKTTAFDLQLNRENPAPVPSPAEGERPKLLVCARRSGFAASGRTCEESTLWESPAAERNESVDLFSPHKSIKPGLSTCLIVYPNRGSHDYSAVEHSPLAHISKS